MFCWCLLACAVCVGLDGSLLSCCRLQEAAGCVIHLSDGTIDTSLCCLGVCVEMIHRQCFCFFYSWCDFFRSL